MSIALTFPGQGSQAVGMGRALAENFPAARQAFEEVAAPARLELEVKEFWYFPPTPFDLDLVAAVRQAAEAQGYPHQDIVSGAGHDAVYMARVAPTAMVFVPCVGGISHNEIEDAKSEDLTAGCNVLLNALLDRANAVSPEAR